ncbi:alkaline phosphatase D family protein [Pseudomonas citri]|uniref:alkaline phosphatase D family protein n=1 Tax=Pseudomonas citri TaxID=2978349 RepID=UPI0021B5B1CF|nr:alkaline phosphatase D family protein [Pseudomonas citri]
MQLKEATVGPIVGYTDSKHTRLWFRGTLEAPTPDTYNRCFGALRLREKNGKWQSVMHNKMSPNFDMTAVFVLQGLKAQTQYEYQVGWIILDTELEGFSSIPDTTFVFPEKIFSFRSGKNKGSTSRSYVAGSCRYLLKLFGLNIFDDRGDKMFQSILKHAETNGLDGVVMVGDQIYADDLNFVSPDTRINEFFERYRQAFKQPYIRELMSRYPTYMILDDHEIEDNWPSNADVVDWKTLYPAAIHAYLTYQASHSPLYEVSSESRIEGVPNKLWYSFSDGLIDWFFMDSRTERSAPGRPVKMISDVQMDGLLNHLKSNKGGYKFVVTSVPMFPDFTSETGDKWMGYPEQREVILSFIKKEKIKKVYFLSGDVHCSFCAELTSQSDPDFRVYQIVSSSFFWPYPHMSASGCIIGPVKSIVEPQDYVATLRSEVYSDDNFSVIDVKKESVTVSFYDRKNKPLGGSTVLKS